MTEESGTIRPPEIWREPHRGGFPPPGILGLSGLEQMGSLTGGGNPRPPISHLTGMAPTLTTRGISEFTMPATAWLLAPGGVISGGTLAILADGPLGVAFQSLLPVGTGYATAELSLQLVRRVTAASGVLTGRGRVIHAGRTLGLTAVEIVDADNQLVAHGTSRLMAFPVEVPPGPTLAMAPPGPSHPPDPYLRECPPGLLLDEVVGHKLSGLEIMLGHIDGSLPAPPIHFLTGLRPVAASARRCTFELPATPWLCSPLGTIEGGCIAMLADSALSCAVQTDLAPGETYRSVDLKVNYTRPVQPRGQTLTASAEVIHRGRTLAIANATVRDPEGKLVATATGSCLIR